MFGWNSNTGDFSLRLPGRPAVRPAGLSALLVVAIAAATTTSAAPIGGVYPVRCSMCHQPDAAGLPGQYPRLSGRIGTIAGTPDGRHYLALVLLNGMYGSIVVDGHPLVGLMPSAGTLPDKDIADTLNAVVRLKPPAKKVAPFTAAEIAGVRAEGHRTTAQVAAERVRLVGLKLIP